LKPEKISKELFKFIRSIEKQILDKKQRAMYEIVKIYMQAIGFCAASCKKGKLENLE
jgi:hypothetical protein